MAVSITRGSSAWRVAEWGASCDRSTIVSAYWIAGGGKIQCHRDAVSAFRALGRVLRLHRYHVRDDVTGCYNCRQITGGATASAHAYGLAIDVNWDTNPYRHDKLVTDMDRAMIVDVQHIMTSARDVVFRWGGDWDGRPETPHTNYDAMHFEIIATLAELRRGFLVPVPIASDRSTWPLLDVGEFGPGVELLQTLIGMRGDDVDSDFGADTRSAVQKYQASRGMPADGVVGLGTWTSLFSSQPVLAMHSALPDKGQSRIADAIA